MNIALVDDMEADRLRLEKMIDEYGTIQRLAIRVDHFSSGEAILEGYEPFRYSVIFLDIFMDGVSGVETARAIRAVDDDVNLIFLTTSEMHRSDAFSLFASAYLCKPCREEQVFRTLDHIFHLRTEGEKRFSFSYDKERFSLRFADVVSLETDGNYLSVSDSTGRTYRTRMTFSAAMERLDSRFLVLMKGIAVNMDHIALIRDGQCIMRGGTVFPLHSKRQTELREKWLNYKFAAIRKRTAEMGGRP